MPETDHVAHVKEEVVNLSRQLDLEVNYDDVNELLDSHSQDLAHFMSSYKLNLIKT